MAEPGLHYVLEMTSYGAYMRTWGYTPGPAALSEPVGIATDSSGNVYVADQALGKVVKYSATGTFIAAPRRGRLSA